MLAGGKRWQRPAAVGIDCATCVLLGEENGNTEIAAYGLNMSPGPVMPTVRGR